MAVGFLMALALMLGLSDIARHQREQCEATGGHTVPLAAQSNGGVSGEQCFR